MNRAGTGGEDRPRADPRDHLLLTAGTGPSVPLLFVEDADSVYVIPSDSPAAWFSAAVREGGCRIRFPNGREMSSLVAIVRSPEALEQIRSLFESKYGAVVWTEHFDRMREALQVFSGVAPRTSTAADRIRGEFDAVSWGYDGALARKPIDRYLKDRVVAIATSSLSGSDPILEIGSGTGYHTLPLLAAGHRVTAIDLSEGMLDRLRLSADRRGFGGRLETRTARLADLETDLRDIPDGNFAAAFSAFGAFNLEPDVGVAALRRLLRPGGKLLFTSLNRPGVVPFFWDLALGRPRAAINRTRHEVPPGGIRYPLALHLRTPREWDRALSEGFRRSSTGSVSVLAPPFDSDRIVRLLGKSGSEKVRRWDAFLADRRYSWAASEWVSLLYTRL